MDCPFCGKKMGKGTLRSRGSNFFQPEGAKLPRWYAKKHMEKAGAVPLPPSPYTGGDWPEAHICQVCRKIVINY